LIDVTEESIGAVRPDAQELRLDERVQHRLANCAIDTAQPLHLLLSQA
jgi:hypothetical protein